MTSRHHPARERAWSDYWKTGALHSLAGSFQGNYTGAIRDFWERTFAPLGADDRVLDIGTGNGALPALLCGMHTGTLPHTDAIDIATPDPAWLHTLPEVQRNRLHFHGGTAIEASGFPEAHFDLVVSQYGLEYSDLPHALPEIARITSHGGRLALVMHHADSHLTGVARAETESIDWLLAPDGLMAQTAAILPWMALAARGEQERLAADPRAGQTRDRFNQAMRSLDDMARRSRYPDALYDARTRIAGLIDAVMRRTADADAAGAAHAAHAAGLAGAHLRSEELCRHALDETALATMRADLTGLGFTGIETSPLHHDRYLIGWTLQATKAHP